MGESMKIFERVELIISAKSTSCSETRRPSDLLKEQLDDIDQDVEVIEILKQEPMKLVLCNNYE